MKPAGCSSSFRAEGAKDFADRPCYFSRDVVLKT